MKRRLKSFRETEREALNDPVYRQAYLEVLNEEIGAELRSLREARQLTQAEVAVRMGYANRSRIAQIEGSEGLSLALDTVVRYAQALGYRAQLIFQNEHESRPLIFSDLPQRSYSLVGHSSIPNTNIYSCDVSKSEKPVSTGMLRAVAA